MKEKSGHPAFATALENLTAALSLDQKSLVDIIG